MRYLRKSALITLLLLFAFTAVVAAETYEAVRASYDTVTKAANGSRASFTSLGDRFYKVYAAAPNARNADYALLYAGKSYKISFEKFKQDADFELAQRYLRIVSTGYDTAAGAEAYLESADLFVVKNDLASAQFTLNRVKTKFPGSQQAIAADSMLADLERMNQRAYSPMDTTFTIPSTVVNTQQQITRTPTPVESVREEEIVSIDVPSGNGADVGIGTASVATSTSTGGSSMPSGITAVKDIRFFSTGDYTRVVIDLSQDAIYEEHWLKENVEEGLPPRLYLDIHDSAVENRVSREIDIKDGLVTKVRWGYNRPGVTRVVLDSEGIGDFTVFQMSNPSRIVMDVTGAGQLNSGANTASAIRSGSASSSNSQITGSSDDTLTLASSLGIKIGTIVIDPGHGGKDPGCVYNGMLEKDIVLEISKYLAEELRRNTDLNVYLTRETDVFIPLEERTAIANQHKADLFISVHINAAKSASARGFSTYVLNTTNDRSALELAAFENQASTKSMSDLQGILADIMRSSKLEESLLLAGSAQKGMADSLRLETRLNNGVKQAPFYVLVGATMPAILVEAGFLSNSEDAANLRRADFRRNVAHGIYEGAMAYVDKYNK